MVSKGSFVQSTNDDRVEKDEDVCQILGPSSSPPGPGKLYCPTPTVFGTGRKSDGA